MCQTYVLPLILLTISCLSCTDDTTKVTASCPEYQRSFGGSCYEIVSLQLTFFSAQAWCEQRGGHLAFIPDEETYYFLQKHLDPRKDIWFGAAFLASKDLQYSTAVEDRLSWLDGSPISYSRWVTSPQPGAACGHIVRDSGFQWEATVDCNKKLPFICQNESWRSIACAGRNSILQCGSGQVLMIDGGFYGRKSAHYCRSMHTPPMTPTQLQCSWVDVAESLTAHCHDRQVCQISEPMESFGEPCPQLGSYLSVDYHCKDGLTLSVNTVAAVFDDVTIQMQWLFHVPLENLRCKLGTGDGRVIYLYSLQGLDSSVMHRYISPGTFVVTAECSSPDLYITVQKVISIQERIQRFGSITCYAGKMSFHATDCKALYREQVQLQIDVNAGSNVTYRIQSDEVLLSSLCVVRGNVPQNITVTPEILHQLGLGCHHLTLYASNTVTFPEVSTHLQICVLEEVSGLQASGLAEDVSPDSTNVTVGVSLERGVPVLLLFTVNRHNSSFFETREMISRKSIFHIGHQIRGCVQMKLRAWNVFSSLEVDVDMPATCSTDSVEVIKKHVKVARDTSSMKISAQPSNKVHTKRDITLVINGGGDLNDPEKMYRWECKHPCKCQDTSEGQTYVIDKDCLPRPFEYIRYYFKVINRANNDVEKIRSICIILIPRILPASIKLICTEGCNPVRKNKNAIIKMTCTGTDCYEVAWYITDLREPEQWTAHTRRCYDIAGKRPLRKIKDSGTQYTVSSTSIEMAIYQGVDINVVIIYDEDDEPLYKKYTIKTTTTVSTTTKSVPITPSAVPANTAHGTGSATTITTTIVTNPVTMNTNTNAITMSTNTTPVTMSTSGDSSLAPTTTNANSLKCTISPLSGTIFDVFNIICNTEIPCSSCQYCLKTLGGTHLRCSENNELTSVFLPLGESISNYRLIIRITAKSSSFLATASITTQVLDSTGNSSSSVDDLKAAVENAVTKLKEQCLLSAETVGQIFNSVSNKLNVQSDESTKADRQKLRELMLDVMITTVKTVPSTTPEEVQITARSLSAVVQTGTELSPSSQEEASLLFANLSSYLLHMDLSNSSELFFAASNIVEGISNILHYSSNKNISDALLVALKNTLSALLRLKNVNEGPTIINQDHISMLVNRVAPGSLHTKSIKIPNCLGPAFSLPKLLSDIIPSREPVDIQMVSLDNNPFSWNERGNISGMIGSLSLTAKDGSYIPVNNLNEDIEILLPRPLGDQATTSMLDLGNYSTTVIDLPSADSTLVLKMVPSSDPLPFKLFLGYMDYPTDTNFIAMTEMPHQGTTQEDRYTWILEPQDLKGNTGRHYLVVRPIVGPGIRSINASLSIASITTACQFWDEPKLDWNNYGCRVGAQTTQSVTQCLCNHLTLFGSSFFVTPNLVDPSRTAELFGTFAENPVVVSFVGSLFVTYLLVVVWARRKDIQDVAKVKVTVLEDNNPMDEYYYLLSVKTGHRRGASTSSQVVVTLLGAEGNSEPHHLTDPKKRVFERGAEDQFLLTVPYSLGDLQGIRLWHNNFGSHPAWYVGNVMVQDLQTEQKWYFLCNSWLAIGIGDCSLDKVFPVSSDNDLKRFSNLFFMKTSRDFSDGHLWYSVIHRPASSTFTSVQRVSCCFSLSLCTMLTSIMFYGIPTDPSEQTMDLGHFEFTWQQFMIGVQSSLIMFPINILIVSIFRNTRPRETCCCKCKTARPDTTDQTSFPETPTKSVNDNVTLETVIKDIKTIASSLSQTVKSNIPCTEFGPGQQVDVSAVLSVVEDFNKQNNKTSDPSQVKTQNSHNSFQPQLPEGGLSMHPSVDAIEKKSNKTQYLYWQLCHIDKELSLLGPSGFHSPGSYSQALQQVQAMKTFLEDQIFKSSCINPHEPTEKKCSLAVSPNGDCNQKKVMCCHGGLPWWFIFVGWLLVIGTSVVSGYFTMLYGLKFGKGRSVSWLVSMVISFFQSVIIIQPLKVICLAVFFALVIRKVDEDYQNGPFLGNAKILGDRKDQQAVRRESSLYEPPAPADIEKMRRNKILEQKAFALLREILTYMGFMWMLLLVAHGQRDSKAFFLNRHIQKSFSEKIFDSMSLGDMFTWANTSLLSNLYGVYPGFITDGNCKLVGNARLRQLRVQRNSCQISGSVLQLIPDCHASYSWEAEDMGSYDPGWNHSAKNISSSASSPWKYQPQAQLRVYPVWGKTVLYRGGGFVAELGPDLQNASSTLEYLFRNQWMDVYTRAIFVEFTVYNANVNLFCIVTLLLETTAVGAFQFISQLRTVRLYQSTSGLHIFVMAAHIMYLLFILHYMFLQGKLMKQQRWAYFRSKWNLLELTIILLSWCAVAVFIKRTVTGNRDMTYYQNHKDQFASFYEVAMADATLQYIIGFLVLMATVKLWHLLRLNPKMNIFTATLQRAWADISGFLVIIVIMFVAYSVVTNVIYGWKISSYKTFGSALVTIVSLQIGIFDYDEVLNCSPLLGGLLFGSCIVFMSFVVLNLFVSVILVAFNQEHIYHKPSDEEEIFNLMLKKIYSLFGIKHKNTEDTLLQDVNKGSGLTIDNSRNIPH